MDENTKVEGNEKEKDNVIEAKFRERGNEIMNEQSTDNKTKLEETIEKGKEAFDEVTKKAKVKYDELREKTNTEIKKVMNEKEIKIDMKQAGKLFVGVAAILTVVRIAWKLGNGSGFTEGVEEATNLINIGVKLGNEVKEIVYQ